MARLTACLALVALLSLAPFLPAARGEDPVAKDPVAKEPDTVLVERRAFAATLALPGTLVPRGALEIACRPEVYGGPFEVLEAAGPGLVVAGQMLVRFDEEPFREEKQNRERDLDLARARLQRQEEELRQKKEGAETNRKTLEIRLRRAEEALVRFREVDRPLRTEQSQFGLLGAEDRLQDEREELAQLEKMYQADDLTEETEEIVIRRARRGLARLERSYGFQKQRHAQLLDIDLPREEQDLVLELERRRQEHEGFLVTLGIDQRRGDLELEKARSDYAKQEKQLRDFARDGESLRLRAPADGLAVPGEFAGAAWKDVEGAMKALLPGSKAKPEQVLFTLVRPGDVDVRTAIGEADVLRVKVGQAVEVVPAVDGGRRLAGEVASVLPVASGGKHAVAVALKETFPALLPGQSVALTIALRRVEAALVIPAAAVRVSEAGAEVWVWKDGQAARRAVRLGEKGDGRLEILEGLEEGERILARPPAEGK